MSTSIANYLSQPPHLGHEHLESSEVVTKKKNLTNWDQITKQLKVVKYLKVDLIFEMTSCCQYVHIRARNDMTITISWTCLF